MSYLNKEDIDSALLSLVEEYFRAERIEKAKDFFYFSSEYFYNKYPPSKYHREIADALQDFSIKKLAIIAPRQSSKTTLLQRFVIWSAIMKKSHFIVVIGQNFDRAKDFIKDIKSEIETNEKLYNDFGNLKGKVWAEESIRLGEDTQVMAYSKTSLRGVKWKSYRPDLVIIDDLESEQTVNTKTFYSLKEWFFQTVLFLGDSDTRYIMLGTLLSNRSILRMIIENPSWKKLFYKAVMRYADNQSLWAKWYKIISNKNDPNAMINARKFFEEHKEEMLKGAETFWEENPSFDYYNLMIERYVSPGLLAFESERQNNPIQRKSFLVPYDAIQFFEEAPTNLTYFLGVDPSLGVEDYTAFVLIGTDEFGTPYIIDAYQELIDNPNRIIEIIEEYDRSYNLSLIGIEAFGFQRWLKALLLEKNKKIAHKVVDITYQLDSTVKGQKKIKLGSMRNNILRSRFNRNLIDLIEQIVGYPDVEHDDLLDALFLAYTVIEKYAPLLIA